MARQLRIRLYRLFTRLPLTGFVLRLGLLLLRRGSYLKECGWLQSAWCGWPVDAEGRPIPWMNYSTIEFLEGFLHSQSRVFEYGGGQSTKFFAARSGSVTTVEHDPTFCARLSTELPQIVSLHYEEEEEAYVQCLAACEEPFDLIVVDGIYRPACLRLAPEYLKPDGIIVLDDADREEYSEAVAGLKRAGFKSLRLSGLSPVAFRRKTSLLFFRELDAIAR